MYNPFIKRKVKKLIEDETRRKEFKNLKDIHSILVLFDTNEYDEADAIIERLKSLGKKVNAMAYKDKKDEYDYSETPYYIVDSKTANDWFDNKLDELGEKIAQIPYDAVFDLSINQNPILEYLLANADSRFKIGLKKGNKSIYDLSISSLSVKDNNNLLKVRELGNQILYYLDSILSGERGTGNV